MAQTPVRPDDHAPPVGAKLPNVRELLKGAPAPAPGASTPDAGASPREPVRPDELAPGAPGAAGRPLSLDDVLAAFEAVSKKTRGGVYRVSTEEILETIRSTLAARRGAV